jgi:hypothetical protein
MNIRKALEEGKKGEEKKGDHMKSLSIKLGVILVGLSIFGHTELWGEDWKYFSTGADGTIYWYDAQGVTYHPNRVIQVWIKKVKAEEIMGMVKSGGNITASELEQMTLGRSYERSLIEIDCAEKTFNHLQKFNYDSKGVLKSGESKLGAKKKIQKNSNAEKLYKIVCK